MRVFTVEPQSCPLGPLSAFVPSTPAGSCSEQVGDFDQVVGVHLQPEYRSYLGSLSGFELTKSRILLYPSKDLFVSLPGVDRLGVALMACSAAINRSSIAAPGVPCPIRCHTAAVQLSFSLTVPAALVGF